MSVIATNRKAFHDYEIEREFEAGIVLLGWEVKSIRQHQVQLSEGYVIFRRNEAWLTGVQIMPLATASTHIIVDPLRTRKLLLTKIEINRLKEQTQQQGYSIIPLKIYLKKRYIKLLIGLAKGRKLHDKRLHLKQRDWEREKQQLLKTKKYKI